MAAVVKAREALASDLGTLGFTVLPSGTNFLLVMPKEETLTVLLQKQKAGPKVGRTWQKPPERPF